MKCNTFFQKNENFFMRKGKAIMAKKKSKKPMVWHIHKFQELYELPDDIRWKTKSLKYVKLYIRDVGEATCQASRQWEHVRLDNPGMAYYTIHGIFDSLLADAALRSRKYRGYLVNYKEGPEIIKHLAARLRVEVQDLRSCMSALAKVGLIERVPLPKFAELDVDAGGETVAQTVEKRVVAKRKVAKRKPAKKRPAAIVTPEKTESPEIPEKFAEPSERQENDNDNIKKKTTSGNAANIKMNKKAAAAAPLPEKEKGLMPQKETLTLKTGPQGAEAESLCPTASPPLTATPLVDCRFKPTKADESHDISPRNATGPQTPPTKADETGRSSGSESHPAASCPSFDESRFDELYDRSGDPFARAIFQALGLTPNKDDPQYARDMGCFAAQWSQVLDGDLHFAKRAWLWDRAVEDAASIRRSARNGQQFTVGPAAVWVSMFKKLPSEITTPAIAKLG